MVSAGSNLTPADWPIVRTRGDSMVPEEFTLTIDGTALTPTSAIAQVRTARSRGDARPRAVRRPVVERGDGRGR